MSYEVTFRPSGRGQAQCPSNPEYPNGVDVSCSNNPSARTVKLPYPAPECGLFIVRCTDCGYSIAVTATGRRDDPRSVRFACSCVGVFN
jgi:predicted RNA-binding Zn-ribbon protein involved in translation (DUF1610 family)